MGGVKQAQKKPVATSAKESFQAHGEKAAETQSNAVDGIEIHSQTAAAQPEVVVNVDNNSPSSDLYRLLATISQRIHKLEDHFLYNRLAAAASASSKYTSSAVVNLSPVLHNYFSLIKSQFLNLENKIDSKFASSEHKFSNAEIEDGIWKKTINWKMEEMSSKVSVFYKHAQSNHSPLSRFRTTRTKFPSPPSKSSTSSS